MVRPRRQSQINKDVALIVDQWFVYRDKTDGVDGLVKHVLRGGVVYQIIYGSGRYFDGVYMLFDIQVEYEYRKEKQVIHVKTGPEYELVRSAEERNFLIYCLQEKLITFWEYRFLTGISFVRGDFLLRMPEMIL